MKRLLISTVFAAVLSAISLSLALLVGGSTAETATEPREGMAMIVVYSDDSVKAGPTSIEMCAAIAEMALDGKVLQRVDDDDAPYAMAATCAPADQVKRVFGKRHTP